MRISKTSESEIDYSMLTSLGSFYPLSIFFDWDLLKKQLEVRCNDWLIYNKSKPECKREGLGLFTLDGRVSGEDLTSIREYNSENRTDYNELSFRVPTPYWKELTSLSEPLKPLENNLGRSHLIRLKNGGFFPPHRDLGETFRLIAFFNCSPNYLIFTLDDQKIFFQNNILYFANARKTHSLFSFQEEALILVLNVEYSDTSLGFVMRNLLDK